MPWSAARASSAAGAAWPPTRTRVEAAEGVDRAGVVEQGRELCGHERGEALRDAQATGRLPEGVRGEVLALDGHRHGLGGDRAGEHVEPRDVVGREARAPTARVRRARTRWPRRWRAPHPPRARRASGCRCCRSSRRRGRPAARRSSGRSGGAGVGADEDRGAAGERSPQRLENAGAGRHHAQLPHVGNASSTADIPLVE